MKKKIIIKLYEMRNKVGCCKREKVETVCPFTKSEAEANAAVQQDERKRYALILSGQQEK